MKLAMYPWRSRVESPPPGQKRTETMWTTDLLPASGHAPHYVPT